MTSTDLGLMWHAQLLGRGLAKLPRDQIFVATKVGKYKPGEPEDFSAERVKRSVHESLERLGAHLPHAVTCADAFCARTRRRIAVRRTPASMDHQLCTNGRCVPAAGLTYIDLIHCHDIESAVDMKQVRSNGMSTCVFAHHSEPHCASLWCCIEHVSPHHDEQFCIRTQIVTETLPALQELKKEGLVRHIGITGLPLDIYSYILDRSD